MRAPARVALAAACAVICLSSACGPSSDAEQVTGSARARPTGAVAAPAPPVGQPLPSDIASPPEARLGTPAASQRRTFAPTGIRLLGTGAPTAVERTDVDQAGRLRLPARPSTVGWWVGGALPGDPRGSVVLGGHIDSRRYGLGFFAQLLDVEPGGVIELTGDGLAQSYVVQSASEVAKDALSTTAAAFDMATPGRLVLITCTGSFNPRTHHYDRNLVVIARPRGEPHPS
jgi:hypothetical protein